MVHSSSSSSWPSSLVDRSQGLTRKNAQVRNLVCSANTGNVPMFMWSVIAGLSLLAASADAQTVVIHAGKLLDRPGEPPRGPSTIYVRDGRIERVVDGVADAPSDATVVELGGRFVLPGLIDAHVHLDSDKAGVEAQLDAVTLSDAAIAYEAAANARKTLMAGFTTVRNLGDEHGVTLALRDATAAGKMPGPRIVDAGNSISTTAGHMDETLGYREDLADVLDGHNVCDGVESCRRAVRLQIRRGADVIKIATT